MANRIMKTLFFESLTSCRFTPKWVTVLRDFCIRQGAGRKRGRQPRFLVAAQLDGKRSAHSCSFWGKTAISSRDGEAIRNLLPDRHVRASRIAPTPYQYTVCEQAMQYVKKCWGTRPFPFVAGMRGLYLAPYSFGRENVYVRLTNVLLFYILRKYHIIMQS